MARVLAWTHTALAVLAGIYAALMAPVALLTDDVASTWALVAVSTAGALALAAVLLKRPALVRLVVLLHAVAAFVFLGAEALPPALLATLLFALGVAVVLRRKAASSPSAKSPPPQP